MSFDAYFNSLPTRTLFPFSLPLALMARQLFVSVKWVEAPSRLPPAVGCDLPLGLHY